MNRQGSFIVHPDTTMLNPGSLKNQLEMYPSEEGQRLAEAMKNGESGSIVLRLGDTEYYVFYCPSRNPDWSLNIFCPSDEIFESYHQLLRLVIIVTIVGLLVLLLFSLFHIAGQLLPLYRLDKSAQKLAEGHFDVAIADTSRQDEIGHLQRAFRAMQQSLAVYLEKITEQRKSIDERGEELRTAYMHVKEEENAKAAFIHSATDQLSSPIIEISLAVSRMGQEHSRLTHDEIVRLAHTVDVQTQIVVDLLDKMLKVANDQSC
jgi:methyl-accepting chemotaxis protein/sigma-B regulation protein RsbU (phosphoserine phosphatase)